jgi:hypothetical protein
MDANRHVRPASPFVARPVPWLWPLHLGEGTLALLQGAPAWASPSSPWTCAPA